MDLDRTAGALLIARSDAGLGAPGEIDTMQKACKSHGRRCFRDRHELEGNVRSPAPRDLRSMEQVGALITTTLRCRFGVSRTDRRLAAIAERHGTTIVSCTHAADELTHPVLAIRTATTRPLCRAAAAARSEIHELVVALGAPFPPSTASDGTSVRRWPRRCHRAPCSESSHQACCRSHRHPQPEGSGLRLGETAGVPLNPPRRRAADRSDRFHRRGARPAGARCGSRPVIRLSYKTTRAP